MGEEEKHATGHYLVSTREEEVTFSPLKGTELGEEEWGGTGALAALQLPLTESKAFCFIVIYNTVSDF